MLRASTARISGSVVASRAASKGCSPSGSSPYRLGCTFDGEPVGITPSTASSTVSRSAASPSAGRISGMQWAPTVTAPTYLSCAVWLAWTPTRLTQAGTMTSGLDIFALLISIDLLHHSHNFASLLVPLYKNE